MRLISKHPKLSDFWERRPDAEKPLLAWCREVKHAEWKSFADVRASCSPSASQVGKFTVFNIGGNKYRLITMIHFNRGVVYVRHILTHAEYDLGTWKEA